MARRKDVNPGAGMMGPAAGDGEAELATGLESTDVPAARPARDRPGAGLAPVNADSGPMRGQRHTRGGRAPARKALYMAALCSTLHNPLIRAYYKRLRAKGKPANVALTAVMRKLLLHLNSLLKTTPPIPPKPLHNFDCCC